MLLVYGAGSPRRRRVRACGGRACGARSPYAREGGEGPPMSCTLFYETDSDEEDHLPCAWGEGFYAVENLRVDATAEPLPPPPGFVGFPTRDAQRERWEAAAALVLNELVINVIEPPAGLVHPSGKRFHDAVLYDVSLANIRAKLDVHAYPSPAHFEADVLVHYLNCMVLHAPSHPTHGRRALQVRAACLAVLPRLRGLFAKRNLASCPTAVRFSGIGQVRAEEGAQASEHAIAYKRVVEKFMLLDQEGVISRDMHEEDDAGEVLPHVAELLPHAPASIEDVSDAVDEGLYTSDLAFEIDLRCVVLNLLAAYDATSDLWAAAHTYLQLIPQCLEEAGVDAVCVPPQPRHHLPPALRRACQDVLDNFVDNDTKRVFLEPVERVNNYRTGIRRPMDVTTVQTKLDLGLYRSPQTFVEDMRLMLQNCKHYNAPSVVYHTEAVRLSGVLEERLKRHAELVPDSGAAA